MFGGKAWKVFTIRGIPVRVDTSWFLMAGLIVWSLWANASTQGFGDGAALSIALFSAVLFFGSILFHEGAHATMCRARGIHVESITLFALGGYTSAHLEDRKPSEEFLVAVVGPMSSLVLGLVMLAGARALGTSNPAVVDGLHQMGELNLLLAAFNILPGYPLDGGRVLRAGVMGASGNRMLAAKVAGWSGQIAGAGMIAFGALTMTGTIHANIGGPFLILIGFMVLQGARGSEQREELMQLLNGATVADAMGPPPTPIPAQMSLTEALDTHLRVHPDRTFPVVDGTRLVGLLTFAAAAQVGQHSPLNPVSTAMIPLGDVNRMQTMVPLGHAITLLGGGSALALDGEDLVGSISVSDISRFASLRERSLRSGSAENPPQPQALMPSAPTEPNGDQQTSTYIPPRPDV
jgi:Zn-dependent protease